MMSATCDHRLVRPRMLVVIAVSVALLSILVLQARGACLPTAHSTLFQLPAVDQTAVPADACL